MKELDNYLKNKLSEKQEEKITKALFQRHFDEEMKNRWSKELSDKYNVLPSGQTKNTFSRRKWLLMAASLILGLISVFLYQNTMKQNTTQLADEHLAKIYTHIGLKKGIETDEMRTNAIDAYNTNDYAKTILLYEKIIASEDKTIEDFFFCGLSYLYSGQAVKAIPLFQEGLTMPPSPDLRSKEILRWYLALAYIKSENLQEAKKELIIIASSNGAKQKSAEELLKSLQ